jgi:hypothetical protein
MPAIADPYREMSIAELREQCLKVRGLRFPLGLENTWKELSACSGSFP